MSTQEMIESNKKLSSYKTSTEFKKWKVDIQIDTSLDNKTEFIKIAINYFINYLRRICVRIKNNLGIV